MAGSFREGAGDAHGAPPPTPTPPLSQFLALDVPSDDQADELRRIRNSVHDSAGKAKEKATSLHGAIQKLVRVVTDKLVLSKRARSSRADAQEMGSSEFSSCDTLESMPQHGSSGPHNLTLEFLRNITNNFSHDRLLGEGGFGTVYKGVLYGKDHSKEVAVKLLHHSMPQKLNYEEEFRKEFENVRRLNHPNIVQLLGFCYETKHVDVQYEGKYVHADKIDRALCFDYMHNGSLQQHLDDHVNRLDWPTCYKIIKGTCEGLKYLHEGLKTPMYHLDLKPGNILLDKNMTPKLADFGLSKLVLDNETHATSSFWGTRRYCPPEYLELGFVSNKFDIFSLGVVMLDIVAGPKGRCNAAEMPSQEFIAHVQENWRKRLRATPGCTSLMYELRQVQRCIEIALDCVSEDRKQRPNIRDITSWMDEIENNIEKLAMTSTSQNETTSTHSGDIIDTNDPIFFFN